MVLYEERKTNENALEYYWKYANKLVFFYSLSVLGKNINIMGF